MRLRGPPNSLVLENKTVNIPVPYPHLALRCYGSDSSGPISFVAFAPLINSASKAPGRTAGRHPPTAVVMGGMRNVGLDWRATTVILSEAKNLPRGYG
jgi:hypothetical protein